MHTTQQAYGYYDSKDQILKRLRRAEGQVRGVSGMVQKNQYCIDILTQITAAQAALDKVGLELIRGHTRHCIANAKTAEEREAKADELVAAFSRLLN